MSRARHPAVEIIDSMSTRSLLIVTAGLEFPTGVALLAVPSLVSDFLLGARLDSPQAVVIGQIAGAALISISLSCWLERNSSGSRTGLIVGLLAYNLSVPALLASTAISAGWSGVALWPACLLHLALAIWCVARIRAGVRSPR